MSTWLQGLQVGLVGLLVVFAALMLLLSVIILRKSLSKGNLAQKPEAEDVAQPPVYAGELPAEADDQAVIAAITASIYYMLSAEQEAPQGFIVRRIRRVA